MSHPRPRYRRTRTPRHATPATHMRLTPRGERVRDWAYGLIGGAILAIALIQGQPSIPDLPAPNVPAVAEYDPTDR